MFELFPEQFDDFLDADALPSTEETELNYRTQPISDNQQTRLAQIVLFVPVPVAVLLSSTLGTLQSMHSFVLAVVVTIGLFVAISIKLRDLVGGELHHWIVAGGWYLFAVSGSLLWQVVMLVDASSARSVSWIAAWLISCLIARQSAAWILVGPTVDRERMERWRVNLPTILPRGLSLDCPELLTYLASPVLIATSSLSAGWLAMQISGTAWWWPLCLTITIPFVWIAWHFAAFVFLPHPRLIGSLRMTWKALELFIAYDIHQTPAAGVFRFPTRWLRPPVVRWAFLSYVMILIAFCVAAGAPSLSESRAAGASILGHLTCCYFVIVVSGPLMIFGFLWLTAGTLLDRFDAELATHLDERTADWDNYVDRIINSRDELESQHFLRGITEKGDIPVLVHNEIQEMHDHILGDTGASKTTLALAPLATQLIARGNVSVVIIDLKGDRSLMETCRLETARTGKLPFRWLTNVKGHSTFGFNPFTQSHLDQMTDLQVTQQILRGLELEYGISYGPAFFAAMNEIVLNALINGERPKSFVELSERLLDEQYYKDRGLHEDWKKARHLNALVARLATSEAVNVTQASFPDRPEILEESVDVADLFETPQVVYLNLKSAIEPTNAPAIARTFLWSAFAAAGQREDPNKRVYFLIDEVQQVISDGMKLIFEQFRGLGGTLIMAHQTAGQLNRDGTDLSDTIDSCTAVKQTFRASDLRSLEKIEKISGKRQRNMAGWLQRRDRLVGNLIEDVNPAYAKDGAIRVSEKEEANLSIDELLAIGARRQSSLIRFTFGSGYTQFGGRTVPICSQFAMSKSEYERRNQSCWPTARGAFEVGMLRQRTVPDQPSKQTPDVRTNSLEDSDINQYLDDFDHRGDVSSGE